MPSSEGLGIVVSEPGTATGSDVAVVAGDLDGDGHDDVVVQVEAWVYAQLGAGDGTFGPPSAGVEVDDAPVRLFLADLDADGVLDLALNGVSRALTLRGRGDGTFDPPVPAADGDLFAVDDFDGSAGPDLLVAPSTGSTSRFGVARNAGDGTFGTPSLSASIPRVRAAAAGDFDGDGRLDAGYYEDDMGRAGYLPGDGAGGFGAPGEVSLPIPDPDRLVWLNGMVSAARMMDADRDALIVGLLDSGSPGPTQYFVLRATGSALSMVTEWTSPAEASWGTVADLDGDGREALVSVMSGSAAVVRVDPSGTATESFHGIGPGLFTVTGRAAGDLADVDGDGALDLVLPAQSALDSTVRVQAHVRHGMGALSGLRMWLPRQVTATAVADLDGDGREDVVAPDADGASILFGSADRVPATVHVAAAASQHVAIGDVDEDGDLDIAFGAAGDPAGLTLLVNGGGRTFEVDRRDGVGGEIFTIADVDHDGHADLVERYGALRGPDFVFPLSFPEDAVAVGDIDGDGLADIVGSARPYHNAGDGTFTPLDELPARADAASLGDVNGDGALDLIAVGAGGALSVARGAGDGTFVDATSGGTVATGTPPIVADRGSDGAAEVYVLRADAGLGVSLAAVDVLEGLAAASAAADRVLVPEEPDGLAAGDFDGDGSLDVIVRWSRTARRVTPAVGVAFGGCR